MIRAAALVDGSMTPGVYRVLDDPAAVSATLRAAGWETVLIPPTERTRDFYAAIAGALALPEWFGRNPDALWDSLRDLAGPTALVLPEWTRFARARPHRWARVWEVFEDRVAAGSPPFAVVLA